MDVASMLQTKEGLKLVEMEIDTLIEILTSLSGKHRDTLVETISKHESISC